MVAFNNCGQPGEIRFDNQVSTTPSTGTNDNQDSAVTPDPGTPGGPSGPVVRPPDSGTPTNSPMYRKVEKTLELSETQMADIVFVVDNSISMASEQSNMSSRFPLFINNLKQINWRVGIITTDVDNSNLAYSDGRLQYFENGSDYLDSKIPALDAENMFSKVIQRTESGSGYEQGVFATYRFLERERARAVPFLRADASVNIVYISDADETPYEYNGVPSPQKKNKPEELVKLLKTTWPMKKFQFHSIVVKQGDADCLAQSANEAYGVTYEKLSTETNGIKGSVCASDYGSQLLFLSEKIKDLVKEIDLECEPVYDLEAKKHKFEVIYSGAEKIEVDQIIGKKVSFKGSLPTGQIKLEYFCQVQNLSN
jgi:hypothetical protein